MIEGKNDSMEFNGPIDAIFYKLIEENKWCDAAEIAGISPNENIIRLMRLVKEKRKLALYSDTLPILRTLHESKIPWASCSNASSDAPEKPSSILPSSIVPTVALFFYELGIRKLHSKIYSLVSDRLKISPSNILSIGDRIDCDYLSPRAAGFNAVLLDKKCFSVSNNKQIRLKNLANYFRTHLSPLSRMILKCQEQLSDKF